jgi:hypothetical protein
MLKATVESSSTRLKLADNSIGLSGIIAAQRYLDVHPDADIVILEKDGDVGGVFSRSQYAYS